MEVYENPWVKPFGSDFSVNSREAEDIEVGQLLHLRYFNSLTLKTSVHHVLVESLPNGFYKLTVV